MSFFFFFFKVTTQLLIIDSNKLSWPSPVLNSQTVYLFISTEFYIHGKISPKKWKVTFWLVVWHAERTFFGSRQVLSVLRQLQLSSLQNTFVSMLAPLGQWRLMPLRRFLTPSPIHSMGQPTWAFLLLTRLPDFALTGELCSSSHVLCPFFTCLM